MSWKPTTRAELEALLSKGLSEYDDVRSDWEAIRIDPSKWACPPFGEPGANFWAVAIRGDQVLWFNDIEGGFNWSRFEEPGVIEEYWCNQTEFADVLQQYALQRSESAWESELPESLPLPLIGSGGRITRRQTTYWDLLVGDGCGLRVHFREKEEFGFTEEAFERIEILETHPLLFDYLEPVYDLYFSGKPGSADTVARGLDAAIRRRTGNWAGVDRYGGGACSERLAGGYGLLMRAPKSICEVAREYLIGHDIQTTTPGIGPVAGRRKILVIGANYVVAAHFRFEGLG